MILVTGATGTIGAHVVQQLQAARRPFRALIHTPEKAAQLRERFVGDYRDRASLDRALEGVSTVFLACPLVEQLPELEGRVIEAAVAAGVTHVVKLSAVGAGTHDNLLAAWHASAEEQLRSSGLKWTMLRPVSFMTLLTQIAAAQVRAGTFYLPFGDAQLAIVAPEDVAAVAVAALTDPAGHASKVHSPTGSESLSLAAMATLLSVITRRPVQYVPIPEEAFLGAAKQLGMPDAVAQAYVGYSRLVRAGGAAQVSPDVAKVTGRAPKSLEAWLTENWI